MVLSGESLGGGFAQVDSSHMGIIDVKFIIKSKEGGLRINWSYCGGLVTRRTIRVIIRVISVLHPSVHRHEYMPRHHQYTPNYSEQYSELFVSRPHLESKYPIPL